MCASLLKNVIIRAATGLFKWFTEYELRIMYGTELLRFLRSECIASSHTMGDFISSKLISKLVIYSS